MAARSQTKPSKTPKAHTAESARVRRHPAALEEEEALDSGSSEQPDEARPVAAEGYPQRMPPTSGTLSSLAESEMLPVAEAGLPVEVENLGVQFLRDATEQNNFESEAPDVERSPGAYAMGQMISEGTLEASGQEGNELPQSAALGASADETPSETESDELALTTNDVRSGSLFDEPKGDYEPSGATREPEIMADESAMLDEHRPPPGVDEEARAAEMARMRAVLRGERDRTSVRDEARSADSRRQAPQKRQNARPSRSH
jgi:hypothetical protein